ncbi:GNAT family N-acetyltransferase [Chryseobacterium suipulveris]|uniref:GNAT family N-acetyltransferase n=1 Tax=Chryseobacterium suipulveris TaxID=2929800 RepID=A0ABY4BSA3_9FLAO|nr:GNAT family N-acetyltransferase [Chryseobacterium suipulveris]UOE41654.1 GNAT family N-acetyltransferase [Chryseobacterium suipulveris]
MQFEFRKATPEDADQIWDILQQAIERRRLDGSQQWQNGYPNPDTVKTDIEKNHGFVLVSENEIAVYGALILNDEPAYDDIKGKWLSDGDFVVVHRVAVNEKFHGKGLVKVFFEKIEDFAKENQIYSIKVDTNFDNGAMLHILEKLGYTYCGEVFLSGGVRKAFEKLLH